MRLRFAFASSFALISGCGAKAAPASAPPAASTKSETTVDAGSAAPLPALPDRPMPPLSSMPDPNVARSTRAAIVRDDPGKKRSTKPFGQPFRASLDEKGAAATSRVRLEAGHCYRATATVSGNASSVVLVFRDSTGAKIAESAVLQFPTHDSNDFVCANITDDGELLVGVGRGKGEVTVKWESD